LQETLTLRLPSTAAELHARNAEAARAKSSCIEKPKILSSSDLEMTESIYHVKACSFL
jgi:hypothetical protein